MFSTEEPSFAFQRVISASVSSDYAATKGGLILDHIKSGFCHRVQQRPASIWLNNLGFWKDLANVLPETKEMGRQEFINYRCAVGENSVTHCPVLKKQKYGLCLRSSSLVTWLFSGCCHVGWDKDWSITHVFILYLSHIRFSMLMASPSPSNKKTASDECVMVKRVGWRTLLRDMESPVTIYTTSTATSCLNYFTLDTKPECAVSESFLWIDPTLHHAPRHCNFKGPGGAGGGAWVWIKQELWRIFLQSTMGIARAQGECVNNLLCVTWVKFVLHLAKLGLA